MNVRLFGNNVGQEGRKMDWFWLFVWYSFLGYGLEKLFAAAVGSAHRVRKCFLLLPLCPVYGLSMLAVLQLPADMTDAWWELALYGALVVTGTEFTVHLLYDKLLGVRFWDYSNTKMDVDGRICMPFSAAWGVLVVAAIRYVQPWLVEIIAVTPPALTYAAALTVTADAFFSALVLRRTGDIDLMSLPQLVRTLQTE